VLERARERLVAQLHALGLDSHVEIFVPAPRSPATRLSRSIARPETHATGSRECSDDPRRE
jgi:hypothetical protein